MGDLNVVAMTGRLTRDPEFNPEAGADKIPVCTFSIANNQINHTNYIDVVVFRRQANACADYLTKGRLVAVQGTLKIENYEDQDGVRRKAIRLQASRVDFMPDGSGGSREARTGVPVEDDEPF